MTPGDIRGPDDQASPRPTRVERISLRGRLVTVAVLAVAVALLVGGVLLYVVLTTSLSRTIQADTLSSARTVAALVDAGRLPDPVPVSASEVVQVLDTQGRVLGGSVTADRLTPLVTDDERRDALAGDRVVVPGHRSGLSGSLQVAAVAAGPATAPVTVVAASPTADLEASGRTLRVLLLVLYPLLLTVLAAIAWRGVGAALRPVEALRHSAARIDETSSETERLPVPPARDEISALAVTLNAMLDRVAGARHKQRSFVADAAHELRSPLASMQTQLEVAHRLGEGGTLPTDLLADVHRLSSLVEDLLLLARSDDGAAAVNTAGTDLRSLLPEVVGRYA
ncbi:histidine kinase dimerization/phospho-acceptor domain-containing protein, partial [Lapillicoccus sp.]|uniref:histidine kinase dimerization/phospho-acceptor domain-containing protein n=1 Tax=Lapillicoccus sp. TaxID=1909287 RepID=UPI0039835DB2